MIRFVLPLLLLASTAQAQLTVELSVPSSTPESADVYIAGNFNAWNPGSPNFQLEDRGNGTHVITLPASVSGAIEFKFTLGNWEQVEVAASGADVGNRRLTVSDGTPSTHQASVAAWKGGAANSTAGPTVSLLDGAFEIPQLNRERRVWIYLPQDYESSGDRYPVLYMQDGQNVFDAATSFAGEWGVDEALDEMGARVIVVAIANGGGNRANEYHPFASNFGGGEGDEYLAFLAETLKPHIDASYRTMTGPAHTGIGGSSSAGVIAMYAALERPDAFGRVLSFSPAFFVNPQLYAMAGAGAADSSARVAMVSGLNETLGSLGPQAFANAQRRMADSLAAGSPGIAIYSELPVDGTHSEGFWRREFPAAFAWLFPEATSTGVEKLEDRGSLEVYPNPAGDHIRIPGAEGVEIFDLLGRRVLRAEAGRIDVSELQPGLYLARSGGDNRAWIKR